MLEDHTQLLHLLPALCLQFKQTTGGICRWSVKSCGYRSGEQENWLFTQYIKKMAPSSTNYNVSLFIDFLFTISNCRQRHRCTPTMEVYKFDVNSPQPRDIYTNRNNYALVHRKSGASQFTQSLSINKTLSADTLGFYIAVRDHTSCIQIAQMLVYRYQCSQKQVGLVIFPETAAPITDRITISALCVPNASPVTDMDVTCDSRGHWDGSGTCKCDPGYIFNRGNQSCDREWICIDLHYK